MHPRKRTPPPGKDGGADVSLAATSEPYIQALGQTSRDADFAAGAAAAFSIAAYVVHDAFARFLVRGEFEQAHGCLTIALMLREQAANG